MQHMQNAEAIAACDVKAALHRVEPRQKFRIPSSATKQARSRWRRGSSGGVGELPWHPSRYLLGNGQRTRSSIHRAGIRARSSVWERRALGVRREYRRFHQEARMNISNYLIEGGGEGVAGRGGWGTGQALRPGQAET